MVLHVDDDHRDHLLFQAAGKEANAPFVWQFVNSAPNAISHLQSLIKTNRTTAARWPDLLLLDLSMPVQSGLKVLEYMRTRPEFDRLPVIVFSGQKDPRMTARACKLGAKSVMAKPADFAEAVRLVGALYGMWSIAAKRV
jgi:CheY-like chemotaxis protein